MDCRTISNRDDFDALAAEWDALARSADRPSPFMLHGWLSAWWRHHEQERELRVEAAFADGRLVGGIPLEIERRRGVAVARFMGRHHAALGDVLAEPAWRREAGSALAASLRAAGADYVDLFGLAGTSTLARLAPTLDARLLQRVEAPTLDLSQGWDAVYRAKTSSKKRNHHGRRRRQLVEELGALEVVIARSPDELADALEEAFGLHDLRWDGRPDGSEFTTPVGKAFHRDAIRALAAQDVPRILTLRAAGRAIAFPYSFLLERTMFVHRLAFDPAAARWSPGQIATLDAIEAAAAEGATRVEFLGGGERYKLELADGTEPLHELVGLPASARGRLAALATVASIEARLRLKRSERLHAIYFDGMRSVRRARGRLRPARGAG